MTRYAIDKVLWRYAREPGFKSAFDENTPAALADFELESNERAALEAKDLRAIFLSGAHPFLLYSFAIAANDGWSFDMMRNYVGKLEGLTPGDIET